MEPEDTKEDLTGTCLGSSPPQVIDVIEFFAGIGGMRVSLPGNLILRKITAYEISPAAVEVYKLNCLHGDSGPDPVVDVRTKLVEQLSPKDVDGMADLWTMSPPCQPFTATFRAKHRDIDDPRCAGLKHIAFLLSTIKNPPKWIFFENVKKFHGSRMSEKWYQVLGERGYTWRNYKISPHQIGIPNTRMRFYMICERSNRFKGEETIIYQKFPNQSDESDTCRPLSEFLVSGEFQNSEFLLSEEILRNIWVKDLSIATPLDRLTFCFTAGYSRQLHPSTGSILFDNQKFPNITLSDFSDMTVYGGCLRRFSPKEILNLFGFPEWFRFPEDMIYRLQWKLVGNSLCVSVVHKLMVELLEKKYFEVDLFEVDKFD